MCHLHNTSRINTFIPILAALPLCPPTPRNRTACRNPAAMSANHSPMAPVTAGPFHGPHLLLLPSAAGAFTQRSVVLAKIVSVQASPPARWITGRRAVCLTAVKMRSLHRNRGAAFGRPSFPGYKIIVGNHLHQRRGHYNKSDSVINYLNALH